MLKLQVSVNGVKVKSYTPDCECNAVLYMQTCIAKLYLKALPISTVKVLKVHITFYSS